ncbi:MULTISPECIES: S9 family peptidase [unclassified Leucobacter]|uniref:alpha/beta hydrolase family protein n=1 Tax=unclassified Leucobacter TaxID=2621730 RepID=UPI001F13C54B|nr:alpha/beta hydrolase [Leucobacter sp. CX169]
MRQTAVQIPAESGQLNGVLTLPRDGSARGIVVMVHGDAAVDATQDGLYLPWFEGAADAGFATLSWSKPGVGGSTGNWLNQSMDDRAAEVGIAIDWALAQEDIPTDHIVLWGASQAGWVLPKVVAARTDIDGVVAVGTAINWLAQGRYNLLAELDFETASRTQRNHKIAESDRVRALLDGGASYAEYRLVSTEDPPMTAERWAFVARNMNADAAADLRAAAKREIPILLLAGDHDRNVDVAETERAYRDIFGASLLVQHVDAVHSMARPIVDSNEVIGAVVGIAWPRGLLAPGVIDGYTDFLGAID